MIKSYDVTFEVVDAKTGVLMNRTSLAQFMPSGDKVVAESFGDAIEKAIARLAFYMQSKGHKVLLGKKPFNGLLIDDEIRWLNFRAEGPVSIHNS